MGWPAPDTCHRLDRLVEIHVEVGKAHSHPLIWLFETLGLEL